MPERRRLGAGKAPWGNGVGGWTASAIGGAGTRSGGTKADLFSSRSAGGLGRRRLLGERALAAGGPPPVAAPSPGMRERRRAFLQPKLRLLGARAAAASHEQVGLLVRITWHRTGFPSNRRQMKPSIFGQIKPAKTALAGMGVWGLGKGGRRRDWRSGVGKKWRARARLKRDRALGNRPAGPRGPAGDGGPIRSRCRCPRTRCGW
jgi:hypothetical protein